MKKNLLNILLYSCLSLFILLLILVLTVDVKINPATDYGVGLYTINEMFLVNFDNLEVWDLVSDAFMYASLLVVLFFACIGAYQLFKNKSIKKVDSRILLLGCFMVLLAVVWILFDEIIVVNYRPIYIEGQLEGSFPSTHVLIVTFIYLVMGQFLNMENKSKLFKYVYYTLACFIIVFTSLARIMSLMHWFTDVLGGVLLGLTLYFSYLKILKKLN